MTFKEANKLGLSIRERIALNVPTNPIPLGGWVITCVGAAYGETWEKRYDEKGVAYAEYYLTPDTGEDYYGR